MTNAYVAPMLRNLKDAFAEVKEAGPRTLRGRFQAIREKVEAADPLDESRDLVVFAVDSFRLVAFSAFAKARRETDKPALVTRNSLGLLVIGTLGDKEETDFHIGEDTVADWRLGSSVIAPHAIEVITDDDPTRVDFTQYYRYKIDSLHKANHGCPAYG